MFRLQNASISKLDYYLSRYFTHILRSLSSISKETISRQCKLEYCDDKPIFGQGKVTAKFAKSTDPYENTASRKNQREGLQK